MILLRPLPLPESRTFRRTEFPQEVIQQNFSAELHLAVHALTLGRQAARQNACARISVASAPESAAVVMPECIGSLAQEGWRSRECRTVSTSRRWTRRLAPATRSWWPDCPPMIARRQPSAPSSTCIVQQARRTGLRSPWQKSPPLGLSRKSCRKIGAAMLHRWE